MKCCSPRFWELILRKGKELNDIPPCVWYWRLPWYGSGQIYLNNITDPFKKPQQNTQEVLHTKLYNILSSEPSWASLPHIGSVAIEQKVFPSQARCVDLDQGCTRSWPKVEWEKLKTLWQGVEKTSLPILPEEGTFGDEIVGVSTVTE